MKPSDTLASNAHDQAIDATLTALREAALPPAGLEQRVLQNLAEQTASTPRASWRLAWITVPAALCAVLALIAIPVVRHPQKAPMPVANDAPSSPGLVPVSSPKPPDQLLVGKAPNSHPRPPRVRRIAIVRENPVAAARGNTPPPPAPLTEQERLLLQIAVSGDPAQRAMLNPEVLAREESEGDAEFRTFFAKSQSSPTTNP